MNAKLPTACAARITEVEDRMTVAESRAETLAVRLSALDDRLVSVLVPDEPAKLIGADSREYRAPLGRRLDALVDSLDRSIGALENTMSRLEV